MEAVGFAMEFGFDSKMRLAMDYGEIRTEAEQKKFAQNRDWAKSTPAKCRPPPEL